MGALTNKRWSFAAALGAVTALGAFNFAWQLGSSSLYVDEVQSVQVALTPLAHFLHALARLEVTPPAYFLGLHEWLLRLGEPTADWVYRLPSALAAIALVPVVGWLALRVLGRIAPALFAALLCALSPFVLEHAQRAQGYVFVSLGSAVALAAALEAARHRDPDRDGGRRSAGWLGLSLLAAVGALFTHYLAVLAVGPLCAWMLLGAPDLPPRWRRAYVGVCTAALALLVPLLAWQHSYFPGRTGVAGSAALTGANLRRMIDVLFDGRVSPWPVVGVAVTLLTALAAGSQLWRLRRASGGVMRPFALMAVIAIGGPLALVVLSAAGGSAFWGHLMLTRYAAASVPALLVVVAAGVFALPRGAGVLVGGAALAVAVAGCAKSHQDSGFFFDARRIVAYVAHARTSGEAVIAPAEPVAAVPLLHYGLGRLAPQFQGEPGAGAVLRARRRVWVISELAPGATTSPGAILAIVGPVLERQGYRAVSAKVFPATTAAVVVHAVPAAGR